jgi:hypothetical protein
MALSFQMNQAGKLSDRSMYSQSNFDPDKEPDIIKKEQDEAAESLRKQQLAQAAAQGEAQLIMTRYQLRGQALQNQLQQGQPQQGQPQQGQPQQGQPQQSQQEQPQQKQGLPLGAPRKTPVPQPGGSMEDTVQNAVYGAGPIQEMPVEESSAEAAHPEQNQLEQQANQIAAQLQEMPVEQQQTHLQQLRLQHPVLAAKVAELLGLTTSTDMRPLPEQRPPRRGPEHAVI